ncbi:GDPD-domain-containing protein, partial [Neoconidiobolus thromboides FSU 785]
TMDIDVFGRRPLHYAALNNFPLIYTSMAKVINTIDSLAFSEWWYDLDGCSPLFYSILKGHCEVLRSILTIFPKCLNITLTTSEHGLQNPLSLACSLNYPAVLKILIEFGSNLFLVDEAGESALHMAARSGCSNCTKILLDGAREDAAALINLKDHESGITALSLAAMEGNKDICELFISLGADLTIEDKKLWRPYEHAMFHGYIELGKLLEPEINEQDLQFVEHLKGINKLAKSFSRKRLINECAVVLTLGRNDIRTSIDPIVFFENSELLTELQNLKLVISVVNINDPLANIDLPARDEEPIVLHCPHPSMPQITFDVVPRYSSNCSEILARGSWQIGTSNKPPAESVSIALLSAKTMNVIGHVNFECTIVTPFTHEAITPSSIESKFHKSTSGGSTRLIGHRGLGANQKVKGESSLQVGENTVLSFITAASLGAEYVEFDVQLTKDKVPVIYHDWTVTESGYDLPINAFTLKQFLSIYEKVYKLKDKPDLEKRMKNWAKPKEISKRYSVPQTGVRNRSKSLDPFSHNFSDVKEKMNNKAGFIENEKLNEQVLVRVKGNNPDTIQAPFTTLEETFQKVPEHIGFNIEVKYPMIDEAEEYDIRGSEIELNTFVDSILSVVYEHLSKQTQRPVMFSSFHPEICLLLNLKQNHFPVFFLNDCGYSNMCDPRCNSLKAAVSFATAHQLEGVVIICDPLLNAPRLITSIKQVGLKCFTYGSKNNDLPSVALQKSIGVDAVIVVSI